MCNLSSIKNVRFNHDKTTSENIVNNNLMGNIFQISMEKSINNGLDNLLLIFKLLHLINYLTKKFNSWI